MSSEPQRSIAEIFREGTRVDAALVEAARDALLLHKRLGLPIAIWRNGEVVWVPAEEIEIPDDATV